MTNANAGGLEVAEAAPAPALTNKLPSRSILVLYGSETGNSQEIAEDLDRIAQRLRFESTVAEMNSVQLSALPQYSLVIFVISTTGQGDVPRNAALLWKKLLRRKLPPGCLGSVAFTTFGLGDTSYPRFNWAARKLVRRLEQLGAREDFPSGEADERHPDGLEGLYLRWSTKLQDYLSTTYPIPGGLEPIPEDVPLPPRFILRFASGDGASRPESDILTDLERKLPVTDGITVSLASNERITAPEHFQDVRLLKFDIPPPAEGAPKLELNPGDTITLYPRNTPEDAQAVIDFMGWSSVADAPIDWPRSVRPPNLYTDESFTLRHLLIHNLDITAVPRRSFLRSISHFASDPDQRERLLEFTRTEFLDEYYDYTTRPRRTILEILHEFSSVKLPAERALDTFPVIRGREFSIANGGDALRYPVIPGAQRVEIVAALVRYRTILRRERVGLCSRYIAGLAPGASIPVLHKKAITTYHGPGMDGRPLVGVATGTGVAPVRSLLWHRASASASTSPPPPAHLFFGFRSVESDFHFSADWPALPFLTVHTAQSRPVTPPGPPPDGERPRREYVQDLIRKESGLVADLVRRDAIFLICGGSHKMAQAVKDAVKDAIGGDEEERERVFEGLDWIQEIW
ncbi:related to Probable NADPH reductase TAH18 [Cephalotrichum gorgonifer]|uniref:NADPH-dependent diflavin oxidoreductase 1 n=1 Tax=Cephalotrichum gorgonifer TaxID=2041049 RepID=A0AAE8N5R8_9PEZI|nr:related to Probable NADPH reductase TAH18 [Cephalotrichum gorgonifer]